METEEETKKKKMPFVDRTPIGLGWNIVRTLGEGAFGEVKLVMDALNADNAVAMKVIDLALHPQAAETVRKEALLMRMLRDHPNIIKYVDMRVDEQHDQFQIFLEYADGGELFDQIEPDVGMPTQKAQFYFRQLINGLDYIHSRGVAHRDIKPENLLLTKNDVLKISDFGMATVFRHKGRERLLETRCGTLPYVAPEVLAQPYKAQPADVWSCGVVLVALLSGELAWDEPTNDCSAFCDWTESANLDANPWKKIGTVALALLRTILNENPVQRATIERVRKHPWYKKDFSKERAHLSRINSNTLVSGDDALHSSHRKRTLHTVFEHSEVEQSASQPNPGRRSTVDDCENDAKFSCKRVRENSSSPHSSTSFNTSFSQPENIDSLLLNYSQIGSQSQTPNPLLRLVRRMTRFCVKVSPHEAMAKFIVACDNQGYTVRRGAALNQLSVQVTKDRRETVFVVSVYAMGGDKVLVDCRRSKGDGLEFKRAFVALRQKLADIVCRDSSVWLELQGLVGSQVALSQLSITPEDDDDCTSL